jgi:sugar O-acyltransferase (sialic acid O-acetyltransferase NeuD family)
MLPSQHTSRIQLLIAGAGGFGQVVADVALLLAETGASIEILGFVDDNCALWGSHVLGLPVLGPARGFTGIEYDGVIGAVGDNRKRSEIYKHYRLYCNRPTPTLVHPTAYIARNVELGAGTVICAGAIVGTGSRVGENVILNTGCSVAHHCTVESHVHMAPGSRIAADVHVGEGTLVGVNACAIPQIKIGRWAKIGAGAVVTHPVADKQTVVGVPAHPL